MQQKKIKSHKKVCENTDFCGIVMPSPKNNKLQFDQYTKTDKMRYIVYADLESLIKKIEGCANNPEKSSTTRIGKHVPCGHSMWNKWTFDSKGKKHSSYRGEYCIKKCCCSQREHATNVINFENNKMLRLTKKELKSHQDATVCYICRKLFAETIAILQVNT